MDIALFRQRFKELSTIERDILKILAIAYEPVNSTNLIHILKESDIRNQKGNFVQAMDMKEYRELLDAGGWIIVQNKSELQVSEKHRELVMRMAVVDPQYKRLVRSIQRFYNYREWFQAPRNLGVCIREIRLALYEGDTKRVEEVMTDAVRFFPTEWKDAKFFEYFFYPFDAEWFATFPFQVQVMALSQMIDEKIIQLESCDAYLDFIEKNHWLEHKEKAKPALVLLFNVYFRQGRFAEAFQLAQKEQPVIGLDTRKGALRYLQGHFAQATLLFEDGQKSLKRETGTKKGTMPNLEGAINLVNYLRAKDFKKGLEICEATIYGPFTRVFSHLQAVFLFQLNHVEQAKDLLRVRPNTPLEWIFYGAALHWCNMPMLLPELVELHRMQAKATTFGWYWFALEMAAILSKLEPDQAAAEAFAQKTASLEAKLNCGSILHAITPTEAWERSLEALLRLQGKKKKAAAASEEKQTRLVWWVNFAENEVQPVEQTYGKGGWSKGRNVALKRLKEMKVDAMTEADMEAARSLKVANHGYYGGTEYWFEWDKLLPALVGHPLLFLAENPAVSVELVEKSPQLLVEETKSGYIMHFNYDFNTAGVMLVRETPTRYLVLKITETHAEINRLLEFGKLKLPAKAKDKVIEVVGNLSTVVTVQSELGGQSLDIPLVEGNPMPFIHLLPVGDGFKIEFFVKPFTTDPPYLKPGEGRENVIAELNGAPARASRDLKKEKELARRVEDACPTLQRIPHENREWLFEEIEDCLNVLLELEPLKQGGDLTIEHPKGEKLRIAGSIGFDQLKIGIHKERDWFEVDGRVQVNEHLVMDFRQLLDLTQHAKGRFVELSDGQFLAITAQLKRKLEELDNIFSKTKNDLRFHPLAAHALEDFTGLLHDVETDAAWKKQVNRLKDSKNINPNVPSTFKAELRSYQEEGFRWLSQMAYWGVGACLADDMGLGKTVQALALLLDRAKNGPALVCAPASVVRNWYHEAVKFTPTIRPIVFGEGSRKETLDNLQPFDLLLCSYGLMQQESEMLVNTHFHTIVLDEAQAIKNRATKRSQAAMQLQGDFKIITTGTPVENHLGELWNLFNFLNPGLLGSLDRFNETYATPIEKFQDREKRNHLRRLIQPFILRRRKNDVLDELPEKTEIMLSVELSQEERAFYEALRRKAIESIEAGTGEPGEKRFKILAELMRLRQACCHPKMVNPDSTLSSSKLNLFAETVEELLEGGHKALVFSQFVKHLKIVEEWVKQKGISYQYLDGSTPLPARDKAIRAFQGGEGDLFLISLKAGGFGLNLTAADYVLHLDPWWNPAVEDQASDRAHRIGQQRPVTIYRLVTENTIEDKIVKLHADKRELADSLLEGTEMSGNLSADELLALIKG